MKLTIIPIDGAVYENGLCYLDLVWEGTPADVHALQWQDIKGWIEYKDVTIPNEDITVLPQWAYNAMTAWTVANTPLPPPIPVPPTAEENKVTASSLLLETDWVTLPDVLDTTTLPYLTNQSEYLVYRAALRVIAVDPIDGDIVFPVKPISQWIK